jgi:lauroyl/myristoyl acyltransferase
MHRLWKKLRYRLEWVGLLAVAKFVPLLPRKACFRVALALGALMSILDRQGRKVALANLGAAFGDQMSIWQRRKIVRQ